MTKEEKTERESKGSRMKQSEMDFKKIAEHGLMKCCCFHSTYQLFLLFCSNLLANFRQRGPVLFPSLISVENAQFLFHIFIFPFDKRRNKHTNEVIED